MFLPIESHQDEPDHDPLTVKNQQLPLTPERAGELANSAMENTINVSELVDRLGSDEDAVRKMAVFKLQGSIADPSFADNFIAEGGLAKLRYLVLHTNGNTLAYSLTSFARLLEVDKGWEYVDRELVERVSQSIDGFLSFSFSVNALS